MVCRCCPAASTRRLPPIRPRSWCAGTCFRWSGACTATASGAVSAGSNPAGGTAQRHKFEHSDNLGPVRCRACDLHKRRRVLYLAPGPPPTQHPSRTKPSSAGNHNNGHEAVALPGGRCSSAKYPQLNKAAGARRQYRGQQPSRPITADDPWATLHTPSSALGICTVPDPPDRRSTCDSNGRVSLGANLADLRRALVRCTSCRSRGGRPGLA